ncbi:hypothetical protein [Reichenbachiella sp. MSK19-1]|uniref:hypothetical protein n=1 Tax=Reichenbachiella sp. MSK19-1 TaxID=1897631 RepID=UPI000E6C517C|nr:hypothetical protein [Reichenbachiella sp. MSK19-1]RJE70586.1 hypothetical protein BGP76_10895 [Reichenbachiella sp. MSK19-1]
MSKNRFNINWNVTNTIIAIVAILTTYFIFSNDKEIVVLQSQLQMLQKENEALKGDVDPEWHKKFNNQTQYYKDVINQISTKTAHLTWLNDSLKNKTKSLYLIDSNRVILSRQKSKQFLIKLINAERDSILVLNYQKIDSIRSELDEHQSEQDKLQKAINENYLAEIKNMEEIIEIQKEFINNYQSPHNRFSQLIFFILIPVILLYILLSYFGPWIRKKVANML